MKDSKYQTMIMIGIVLVFLAGVMIYTSLSSPREYVEETTGQTVIQSTIINQTNPAPNNQSVATEQVQVQTVTSSSSFTGVVNINTCTEEELLAVEGIGEKRAALIVAYRNEIGGYTSVDQIKNIKGIGDGIYNDIAPYLTV